MPAPLASLPAWALDPTRNGRDTAEVARAVASDRSAVGDVVIEALVAHAIRQWRLDDATFWQRVKYQSRMIRARQRSALAHEARVGLG